MKEIFERKTVLHVRILSNLILCKNCERFFLLYFFSFWFWFSNFQEKVEYLCSIKQKGTCDPLNNLNCKGTDVCDISNSPGLCIKEELADKYVMSGSKKGLLHEGKKLLGTEKSVESFLKKIEKPAEGTEITDIEEILNQIQVSEEEELIGLTNVQKEVLKCLGLLGN